MLHAQKRLPLSLDSGSGMLHGTLLIADSNALTPIALIIAGSGPTDRDGNNVMMKNNSLKMLAEGLSELGISSLRYDKRGVAESVGAAKAESDLRFNHYVDDAAKWIGQLANDERFNEVIVIGHSEGALIGSIVSQSEMVDKFVSVAGAGRPASELLKSQLIGQPPMVTEAVGPIMQQLEQGNTVDTIPAFLNTLFRPSVQPYLISWFQYDPAEEIGKLDKPVLIVQGERDLQVKMTDAEKLLQGNDQAVLEVYKEMNHILKSAPADQPGNIATYSKPDLPLQSGLTARIANFIKE